MSAFIPPINTVVLDAVLKKKIEQAKENSSFVFCTNAYSLTYDKNGNETYGISELVDFFSKNNHISLVISDLNGEYFSYFFEKKLILP